MDKLLVLQFANQAASLSLVISLSSFSFSLSYLYLVEDLVVNFWCGVLGKFNEEEDNNLN